MEIIRDKMVDAIKREKIRKRLRETSVGIAELVV